MKYRAVYLRFNYKLKLINLSYYRDTQVNQNFLTPRNKSTCSSLQNSWQNVLVYNHTRGVLLANTETLSHIINSFSKGFESLPPLNTEVHAAEHSLL